METSLTQISSLPFESPSSLPSPSALFWAHIAHATISLPHLLFYMSKCSSFTWYIRKQDVLSSPRFSSPRWLLARYLAAYFEVLVHGSSKQFPHHCATYMHGTATVGMHPHLPRSMFFKQRSSRRPLAWHALFIRTCIHLRPHHDQHLLPLLDIVFMSCFLTAARACRGGRRYVLFHVVDFGLHHNERHVCVGYLAHKVSNSFEVLAR